MKYKEIMEIYNELKSLNKLIDTKQKSIDRYEGYIQNGKDSVVSLCKRLKWVFNPTGCFNILCNTELFTEFLVSYKNDLNELKEQKNVLEQKLRDNDLPVNGDVASAEGLVKAIHKMKKVK